MRTAACHICDVVTKQESLRSEGYEAFESSQSLCDGGTTRKKEAGRRMSEGFLGGSDSKGDV